MDRIVDRAEPEIIEVEIDIETDGRVIAEVPSMPGVIVYGDSQDEAYAKARALAHRVIADRLEHEPQEARRGNVTVSFHVREMAIQQG